MDSGTTEQQLLLLELSRAGRNCEKMSVCWSYHVYLDT